MLIEARRAAVDIGDSPLQSFHRMFIDEWLIFIVTLVVLTSMVAWRGVKDGSAQEAPVLAAMLHQH